ncbi:hypothetical protein SUGI_0857060 [Cryptomeria japonica]|nr:hypothetical protein SUGI_0857060 [Cryptomeria japonica]
MIEWSVIFDPWKHKMDEGPIWIRLYNLPSENWEENILKEIGKNLGTLIQIDRKMEDRRFGTYGRIFLSLMSFPPLPGDIKIYIDWGIWNQKVEREDKLIVCPTSKSKGHDKLKCWSKVISNQVDTYIEVMDLPQRMQPCSEDKENILEGRFSSKREHEEI